MKHKILSPLVLVLVFCLGFNPVSNANPLLPFGINGFYPGSGREATDFEKNFTPEGFAATQFKMPPENGTHIQQIGFQIFQNLLNHTGVKGITGKLTKTEFDKPD